MDEGIKIGVPGSNRLQEYLRENDITPPNRKYSAFHVMSTGFLFHLEGVIFPLQISFLSTIINFDETLLLYMPRQWFQVFSYLPL